MQSMPKRSINQTLDWRCQYDHWIQPARLLNVGIHDATFVAQLFTLRMV